MNERPEWVPEWVWRAFEDDCAQYRATRSHGGEHNPEPAIENLKSALRDKTCARVWAALDARKERGERAFYRLFSLLQQCADGVPSRARVPASARRAAGAKVKKQALALRKSLDAVRDDDGHLFQEFHEAMDVLADASAERAYRYVAQFEFKRIQLSARTTYPYWRGAHDALLHIDDALGAIALAADEWARTAPTVRHPDSPHALRLYFLREATSVFRGALGTPLRAAVAALANALFPQAAGCELTATDVAKLAP